jgi:hypothetical protein
MALDVSDDVVLFELAEIIVAGRADLLQKLADNREVANDRCRHQAALGPQIVGECQEDPFVRSRHRRNGLRDGSTVTKNRQPSHERSTVAGLDALPSRSASKISLDGSLIDVGERPTSTLDPAQEPADNIEASPNALATNANLHETSGEALDVLAVLLAPKVSEYPASAQVRFDFHLPVLRC